MLATEYAEYYNIEPQADNEDDLQFKERVSGELRDMGKIIEAHEAFQDERYEENEDVITGFMGAMAQALHGNYNKSGSTQVGDDIAVGHVVKKPQAQMTPEEALIAMLLAEK